MRSAGHGNGSAHCLRLQVRSMEADQTLWIDFEVERLKLVVCDSCLKRGLAGPRDQRVLALLFGLLSSND